MPYRHNERDIASSWNKWRQVGYGATDLAPAIGATIGFERENPEVPCRSGFGAAYMFHRLRFNEAPFDRPALLVLYHPGRRLGPLRSAFSLRATGCFEGWV